MRSVRTGSEMGFVKGGVPLGLLIFALLAGSFGSPAPRAPGDRIAAARVERGIASWYDGRQRTADGEHYRADRMTAAHRTLPFGTLVSVRNLKNGRSAVVRINDRGPFHKGRTIDLSRAAGHRPDMLSEGLAPVEIRIVASPAKAAASRS